MRETDGAADGGAQGQHRAVEHAVEKMEQAEKGAAQGKAAQAVVVAAHAEGKDEFQHELCLFYRMRKAGLWAPSLFLRISVPQAPQAVPHLEEGRAERLAGMAAHEAQVAAAQADEAAEVALVGASARARVVVAEVAGEHHLAQQAAALAFVGRQEQALFRRGKDAAQHVHHGARKAREAQPAQVAQRGAAFGVGAAGEEQVVVVHELAQADAFAEEVAVDVDEQVHKVERRRGHAHGARAFGQLHAVGKLPVGLAAEKALQAAVGTGAVHPRGGEVNLHGHVVEERATHVVVDGRLPRKLAAQQGEELRARRVGPQVDVARHAQQRVGVEQGHALPLEHDGAHAAGRKAGGELGGAAVDAAVGGTYALAFGPPFEEQAARRPLPLGQPANGGKHDAREGLPPGLAEGLLPFGFGRRTFQGRARGVRLPQELEKE